MTDIAIEISRYINAAIRHTDATELGDSDNANRAHDDIVDSVLLIRSACSGSLKRLEPLLCHANRGVRCWAATHLLWELPERAVHVLKDAIEEGGLTGFSARMVVQEWEKGNLRPPWEWKTEI